MKNIAVKSLVLIFSLTIIFHLLVLVRIIPYNIVWGGRLEKASEIYVFEIVSIVLNIGFLVVVLTKSGYFKVRISEKFITILLWVMAVIFLLNTIGNLFSVNNLERTIFTPITFLLTIFSVILAKSK